ncbi:M-phase phosphoprotein 6 [Dermacentor variabilis]|uniref:M-phase phosphoprotein 6 n=1 Tax=Dermacentor variabilis TaxID=34621 RepID=UPI003F5BF79C
MARDTSKTKLSRHLLEMKFMKKSKEKAQKDEEDEEHRSLFNSDAMDTIKKEGSRYIIQESYAPCLGLILPRMSFKGRNLEIERIMQGENEKEPQACKMPGIPDEEMAERYSTLVGTIAKKFDKRKPANQCSPEMAHKIKVPKHFKFEQPSDD